jgi:hypothetical protein
VQGLRQRMVAGHLVVLATFLMQPQAIAGALRTKGAEKSWSD